ncbi:MAG: hypothetical protein JNJ57_04250 [Saprospiraceae bacterium]|nr:hypothetical protein [Saprospiraceae bacterium]
MKSKISMVAFLLVTTVFINACKKESDETCRIKASISKFTYNGTVTGPDSIYYYYDKNNRIERVEDQTGNYSTYNWGDHSLEIKYHANGVLNKTFTHTLDDEGRSVEEVSTFAPPNTGTSSITRKYDDDGYLIQLTSVSTTGSVSVTINEWQNGDLIKSTYNTGSGTSTTTYTYYDDLENNGAHYLLPIYGRLTRHLTKQNVGQNASNQFYYTLDEKGNVKTQSNHYSGNNGGYVYEQSFFYQCE